MGETNNIALIADKVAKDLFRPFGWVVKGPPNTNSPCQKDHANGGTIVPEGGGTHPSDVVFHYDDPYSPRSILLLTDLKSYATGTIKKSKVSGALASLANSVDCANVVSEWADRFASNEDDFDVRGLLFVYNHDGEYDPVEFRALVERCLDSAKLAYGRRIYVIGPSDIAHLSAVAHDLKSLRGETPGLSYKWFTRDLVSHKSRTTTYSSAACIETLLGAWQIAGIIKPNETVPSSLRLYYRCSPDTSSAELEYVLEFLFRYRLADGDVKICLVGPEGPVRNRFQTAIDNMVEGLFGDAVFAGRLARVTCESLSRTVQMFDSEDIGMEPR